MAFSGWPLEVVEFFRGLQADNTKAYWNVHQARYEASVREPMAERDCNFNGSVALSVVTACQVMPRFVSCDRVGLV